jgi:anti-sigma-K factor RskA
VSANDHERIEELLAVRALGGLEPTGLAELDRLRADHGPDCPRCRQSELEFEEVAGRLGFALAPVPVREGMDDEVLERALLERAGPRALPGRRRPGRWARTIAAVAAAVALVAGAFAGGFLTGHSTSGSSTQRALAAFLAHPGTKVVHFGGSGTGNLAVAYRPGERQAYVFGSDLAETPSGTEYELWLFPPGSKLPNSRLHPVFTDGGGSVVVVPVPADASRAALMAVTVERTGGVDQPTSEPVFTAPIQA